MRAVYQAFAEELVKTATGIGSTPVVTMTPGLPGTRRTGAGLSAPQVTPPKPAVMPTKTLSAKVPGAVPSASGANLGTRVSPRIKTVPSAAPAPRRGNPLLR